MPAQNGVRRKQRADLLQHLAAQNLAFDGQAAPLIIIEQDPFLTELLLEHLTFSAKVFDLLLLLLVDPASEYGRQLLPGMKNETHGAPAWACPASRSRRGGQRAPRENRGFPHRLKSHRSQLLLFG
jgi:hypothetical protein